MLTTDVERDALLCAYGQVHFLNFSEVRHLTAEQFMRYLHAEQDVAALLIGYDHHFGSDCLKDFAEYEQIAKRVGLRVERARELLVDGFPVSSSRIRQLLAEKRIDQVNRLLGYAYTVSGFVEHGNAIGTTIGFPTANIRLNSAKQLPATGVYSVVAQVNGVEYKALANIGTNPTVGNDHLSLEVHLLDFQGDIYGQLLTISFLAFLREERKFNSLDELQNQIRVDVGRVQQ
jgi:riboflavin kinase/FMN adenylyltransferase